MWPTGRASVMLFEQYGGYVRALDVDSLAVLTGTVSWVFTRVKLMRS
jgi:hypothetical protein